MGDMPATDTFYILMGHYVSIDQKISGSSPKSLRPRPVFPCRRVERLDGDGRSRKGNKAKTETGGREKWSTLEFSLKTRSHSVVAGEVILLKDDRVNRHLRHRLLHLLSLCRNHCKAVFRQIVPQLTQLIPQRNSVAAVTVAARRPHPQPKAGCIQIDVAPGELLDKISILEIKCERITDLAKLANVRAELVTLAATRSRAIPGSAELAELFAKLRAVNENLWNVENEIRRCERDKDFGPCFVELARRVYRHNDCRAAIKRQINEMLGSTLIEEKDYVPYESHASPALGDDARERIGE